MTIAGAIVTEIGDWCACARRRAVMQSNALQLIYATEHLMAFDSVVSSALTRWHSRVNATSNDSSTSAMPSTPTVTQPPSPPLLIQLIYSAAFFSTSLALRPTPPDFHSSLIFATHETQPYHLRSIPLAQYLHFVLSAPFLAAAPRIFAFHAARISSCLKAPNAYYTIHRHITYATVCRWTAKQTLDYVHRMIVIIYQRTWF